MVWLTKTTTVVCRLTQFYRTRGGGGFIRDGDKYGNLGAPRVHVIPDPTTLPGPWTSLYLPRTEPDPLSTATELPGVNGAPRTYTEHAHKVNIPGPTGPSTMPTGAHTSGGGNDGSGTDATHAGAHAGSLGGRHSAHSSVCERGASGREQSAAHKDEAEWARVRDPVSATHLRSRHGGGPITTPEGGDDGGTPPTQKPCSFARIAHALRAKEPAAHAPTQGGNARQQHSRKHTGGHRAPRNPSVVMPSRKQLPCAASAACERRTTLISSVRGLRMLVGRGHVQWERLTARRKAATRTLTGGGNVSTDIADQADVLQQVSVP